MNQQKVDAIAALLGGEDKITAADIAQVAQQEEHTKARANEIQSAPPHAPLSDEQWATYKAFLMDRAGDADWIGAYRDALTAVQQDRKADVPLMLDLFFKRARNALFAQFEV